MRDRHLRQTCTSLYHQHSRCHSPPCKMRMSSVSSSSKRSGRYRRNMWMSESSLRTSMNVTLRLLIMGYGRLWAINIEESAPVTPGSTARYGLANSCGEIKAMDRRQNMRHGWGVPTVLELRMEVNWSLSQAKRPKTRVPGLFRPQPRRAASLTSTPTELFSPFAPHFHSLSLLYQGPSHILLN